MEHSWLGKSGDSFRNACRRFQDENRVAWSGVFYFPVVRDRECMNFDFVIDFSSEF